MKRISSRWEFVFALLLFFFTLFSSCSKTAEQSANYIIRGIDVSHHNTVLDWTKVKHDNVGFVYLKATEGANHIDSKFAVNLENARQVGLPVGAYHFYTFGMSGRAQAHHFIQMVNVKAGDLIPAIDVEHSPTNPDSKDEDYIKKVIRELQILEAELFENYGVRPIIYTNKHCYEKYIQNTFPRNLIWIVDLENDPSSEVDWTLWQFSHTGSVAGIVGYVDLNYFRFSTKEFSKLFLPY